MRAEDSELLTKVGPGTTMGNFMRQYWFPILKASEVKKDGPPIRFRLLGEDLLAFRDSEENVGVVEPYCPHRRAELFFGRNEECGLRCVYHGWKFDVNGNCVDIPSEPDGVDFTDKIKIKAYQSQESAGMIWVYMGDSNPLPKLPDLDVLRLPQNKINIRIALRQCNYLQCLEGDIDTAHLAFLHLGLTGDDTFQNSSGEYYVNLNKTPKYDVVDTETGTMYGARREAEDDSYYWRVARFLLPCWTMTPGGNIEDHIISRMWVPIDDHNSMFVSLSKIGGAAVQNVSKGKSVAGVTKGFNYKQNTGKGYLDRWALEEDISNDYLIDRDVQKTESYTGIKGVHLQDQMVTESMGSIVDRTQEHLGTSDKMITQTRKRLIKVAKEYAKTGTVPSGVLNPEIYHKLRSGGMTISREENWLDEVEARKEKSSWPDGSNVS